MIIDNNENLRYGNTCGKNIYERRMIHNFSSIFPSLIS